MLAPTGIAAVSIESATIHSAFSIHQDLIIMVRAFLSLTAKRVDS